MSMYIFGKRTGWHPRKVAEIQISCKRPEQPGPYLFMLKSQKGFQKICYSWCNLKSEEC